MHFFFKEIVSLVNLVLIFRSNKHYDDFVFHSVELFVN